jgi:hypothetical protein
MSEERVPVGEPDAVEQELVLQAPPVKHGAASVPRTSLLLYSTNPYVKYLIQREYYNDRHWIWCSAHFNGQTIVRPVSGYLQAPSSDPAALFSQLTRECKAGERHSAKVKELKGSISERAIRDADSGKIHPDARDDILGLMGLADMHYWRPLLYVVPWVGVEHKVHRVPFKDRAAYAPEYQIHDLGGDEFEVVDFL